MVNHGIYLSLLVIRSRELVCSEKMPCSVSLQKRPVESKLQLAVLSHSAVGSLVQRPYPKWSWQLYLCMVSQRRVGWWKSTAALSRCMLCPTTGVHYPHFGQLDWSPQKSGGSESSLWNDLPSSWARTAEELESCSELSGFIRTITSWATIASESLVLSSQSKTKCPIQWLPRKKALFLFPGN